MAEPMCPNPACQAHDFEAQAYTPAGISESLMFVQCAQCGTVVGVAERGNIGQVVSALDRKVRQLQETMERHDPDAAAVKPGPAGGLRRRSTRKRAGVQ